MNQPISEPLDVWVLAGQSNMQGCGLLEGVETPDERVLCFSSAGQWEIAREPLHHLWESFAPVHQAIMRQNLAEDLQGLSDAELATRYRETGLQGAGAGLTFGKDMAEATGRRIGLIAAAHGGTSMDQWSHQRKAEGVNSLYGAMLERIRLAGGQLKGVLWYQGESDANFKDSSTYEQRFSDWVTDLRAEVGQPNLPVLVVQIGRFVHESTPEDTMAWNRIREILWTLPQRVPFTAATSTIDLGLVDPIHIDTPGLIRLGHRLARLAQSLESDPHHVPGPQVVSIEEEGVQPGLGALLLRCQNVTGGWLPRHNMSGFVVCDSQGAPHPTLKVVDASTQLNDPTAIRVLLNGPLTPGVQVGYGLGYNPYCNVADEADMPLCAFLPRPLSNEGLSTP